MVMVMTIGTTLVGRRLKEHKVLYKSEAVVSVKNSTGKALAVSAHLHYSSTGG